MRKIKFRARNADLPRCWIYGYFVIEEGHCYIINQDGKFKVISGTEGQYVGLKDKNGKEIYEGDIIRLHCFNDNLITATIEWSDNGVGFCPRIHNKKIIVDGGTSHGKKISMRTVHSWAGMHSCFSYPRYMEIIGNMYENSELLKEEK